MPNELQFDPDTHTYTINGRRLISVTQALAIADDRRMVDPYYLERGRILHKACEYLDRDELDLETLDDQIRPYFLAYVKFQEDTGFKPDLIELRLSHLTYLYAGTIDRIGDLNGNHVLIDLKSGAPAKADPLQLAAYWELARVNTIPIKRLFDLYLHDDSTYRLVEVVKPKLLLPVFLSALTLTRWRNGL